MVLPQQSPCNSQRGYGYDHIGQMTGDVRYYLSYYLLSI